MMKEVFMKKLGISLFLFIIAIICSYSHDRTYSLDEAIKISAENMNKMLGRNELDRIDIPDTHTAMDLESIRQRAEKFAGQKPVVAILNFNSKSNELSSYIVEELILALAGNSRFIVVDRRRLDLIRQEENFQLSGEVSDESAQAIGKNLGRNM
jgi:hypothetical protein